MKLTIDRLRKLGRIRGFTSRLRHLAPHIRLFLLLGALALVVLPAAAPYFGPDIPRTNDAPTHLYRPLALDRLIRSGWLWPRWSPDLAFGYGYPIFNFFPAFSHYVVELFHLAGLPMTTAYRAVVMLHFVLAAWFSYLLARDRFGPAGGWAAALAYVYSPYLLYDAHVRGSLPESQALALLPLLLFLLQRAVQRGGRWVAGAGLAFAATFMSHHGCTFQLAIPIGGYLLWLGWRHGWRNLGRPLIGVALGVLLISFFWLPVLAEVDYVQSDVAVARGFNYRYYFLELEDLLAWPRLPADPAVFNPPVVRPLPQVGLLLVVALLTMRWTQLSPGARMEVVLWLGLLLMCVFFVTPLSRPAWDHLPLLKLTLTPFRLLGMASLAVALSLAAAFDGLALGPRTLAVLAIVSLALLAGGVAWLYPPREPVPEAPTVADMVAFEVPPLFVGTTTLGEYLPVWVETLPDTSALSTRLAAGESPDRLVVPPEVTAVRLNDGVLDARYRVVAGGPATVIYRQFYFPGWGATADDQPLNCYPSHPHGLLRCDLPAGEYSLRIAFGSTWPRTVGWVLSGVGGVGLILVMVFSSGTSSRGTKRRERLPAPGLLLLVAVVLGGKLFFDRVDTPLRGPALGDGLHHPLAEDFAGELRLLGYDQSTGEMPADGQVTLDLYWTPLRDIGVVYDVALHVVDEEGLIWSGEEIVRPPDYRFVPGTDAWPVDGVVIDSRVVELVDGTPPGEYAFRIGLVRRDTGETVDVHRVGRLVVTTPGREDRPLEPELAAAPEDQPWQGVRLLGSRVDRPAAAPGDPVRITLLWQVTAPSPVESQEPLELALVTSTGETVVATTRSVARSYPSVRWAPGDRLRTEALLRLPASAPGGQHTWQVTVGESPPLAVGRLQVNEPQRRWTAPPLDEPVRITLGEVATLLGANLEPAQMRRSAPLTVTLAWQAAEEMAISYRVFLHLIGPEGTLVAQSDGEPADWTRPTTGWLPGEVVVDPRVLHVPGDAPAGTYTLSCGLYDPATGLRLPTPDGSDAVTVTTISLEPQ